MKTLLLVSDDLGVKAWFPEMLAMKLHITVLTADTGSAACRILSEKTIDVVGIYDVVRECGNVFELIETIRTRFQAPVLYFTGYEFPSDREQAIAAGAAGFATIPGPSLIQELERMLGIEGTPGVNP